MSQEASETIRNAFNHEAPKQPPPVLESSTGAPPPRLTAWDAQKLLQKLESRRWREHKGKMAVGFGVDPGIEGDPIGRRFKMLTRKGRKDVGVVFGDYLKRGGVIVLIDLPLTALVREELSAAAAARAARQNAIDGPPLGADEEVVEVPCETCSGRGVIVDHADGCPANYGKTCSCEGKEAPCQWCTLGNVLVRRKKADAAPAPAPSTEPEPPAAGS